jgi:hypothetical protein
VNISLKGNFEIFWIFGKIFTVKFDACDIEEAVGDGLDFFEFVSLMVEGLEELRCQ